MDHSLVIPFNIITVLMGISAVGIIAVISLSVLIFALALKKGN